MKRLIAPLLVLLVFTVACSPPSAEDLVQGVINTRNNYSADLKSWLINEEGPEPYLYLEVMVVNNNVEESLRTLTVIVEQLDIDDKILDSRRHVLDVAEMTAGIGQSVGVQVRPAFSAVEGIHLLVEPRPEREDWPEFPELDAVRPRI